ncbi:hypothetical protein PG995_010705 [Apiospora arundinis]
MSWLSEPTQQEEMEDMVILRHATLMGRKLTPLPAIYRTRVEPADANYRKITEKTESAKLDSSG